MTIEQESAIKKAYEISYALFRVAGAGTRRPYAEQLEALGLSILGNAARLRFEDLKSSLEAAVYLLRLGGDVGLISGNQRDILLREIAGLEKMADKCGKSEQLPDLDISGIFSRNESGKNKSGKIPGPPALKLRSPTLHSFSDGAQTGNPANPVRSRGALRALAASNGAKKVNPAKQMPSPSMQTHNPAIDTDNPAKEAIEEDKSGNIKERHAKIMDFIRQSGNCRLKDIHDTLPDSSERTIRYDIQALMEEGVVERIGGGGPSTYYRLHEGVAAGTGLIAA